MFQKVMRRQFLRDFRGANSKPVSPSLSLSLRIPRICPLTLLEIDFWVFFYGNPCTPRPSSLSAKQCFSHLSWHSILDTLSLASWPSIYLSSYSQHPSRSSVPRNLNAQPQLSNLLFNSFDSSSSREPPPRHNRLSDAELGFPCTSFVLWPCPLCRVLFPLFHWAPLRNCADFSWLD